MVGWHHWLNGYEFEQTPEGGEGQGSLACCSPWRHKESEMTLQLNNSKNESWQLDWKKCGNEDGQLASQAAEIKMRMARLGKTAWKRLVRTMQEEGLRKTVFIWTSSPNGSRHKEKCTFSWRTAGAGKALMLLCGVSCYGGCAGNPLIDSLWSYWD